MPSSCWRGGALRRDREWIGLCLTFSIQRVFVKNLLKGTLLRDKDLMSRSELRTLEALVQKQKNSEDELSRELFLVEAELEGARRIEAEALETLRRCADALDTHEARARRKLERGASVDELTRSSIYRARLFEERCGSEKSSEEARTKRAGTEGRRDETRRSLTRAAAKRIAVEERLAALRRDLVRCATERQDEEAADRIAARFGEEEGQ